MNTIIKRDPDEEVQPWFEVPIITNPNVPDASTIKQENADDSGYKFEVSFFKNLSNTTEKHQYGVPIVCFYILQTI
jgi:hypothetical protein